ncbi:unnamed protein product [Enterobius vermicularis]|uniref:COMM domain-containing protein n=1 Tax=Enterobius vermicularis TaxID=51028 RepID=A0A0N4VI09_ENTVE|nr:unnamed protein product [Enterobius vermicularis]
MAEEGGYLGAMTYQCLFKGAIERVMQSHKADEVAYHALNRLSANLQQADVVSPSFLFDFMKILLDRSKLNINLQEAFLRMQAKAPTDDLELPPGLGPEFQELSARAIALRRVLSRVPEEMSDRRTFLETIKEIASSIKRLLDATNALMRVVPVPAQSCKFFFFLFNVKRISLILYNVSVSANQLIFQTTLIIKTIREKLAKVSMKNCITFKQKKKMCTTYDKVYCDINLNF